MMLHVLTLATLLYLGNCQGNGNEDPDPCFNFKHLHEKDKRFVSYSADTNNGEKEICDRYLIPSTGQWYYTDVDMPVSAPPVFRCGTSFPIWLAGSIPVPVDGIVDREACLSGAFSDCDTKYNIKIKACSGYSVYFLVPTGGCPEAYCFGEGIADTPPANATTKPIVKHRLVNVETREGIYQGRLEFQCDFGGTNTLEYPFYQVTWLRDGVPIFTKTDDVQNLNALKLTENRNELAYFDALGVSLSCTVRPKYNKQGRPGPAATSDIFFAGVVVENPVVNLLQNSSVDVHFNLTVPFGCMSTNAGVLGICDIFIQMFVPNHEGCDEVTSRQFHCHQLINSKVWNNTHTITINYKQRGSYNLPSNPSYVIQLESSIKLHPLWNNYQLPSIRVNIYGGDNTWKGKKCSSLNDPHMTTFDGRKYENHHNGTFLLYQHQDSFRPMEVQIKFRNCNRLGIYCNCGVAVRAGGDIFVIDFCGDNRIMQFMTCHDRILDVRMMKKNTHIYKVTFPTGTEVNINLYYSERYVQWNVNVEVVASLHDTGNTIGLCGYLSGTCKDDFRKRDLSQSSVTGAKDECTQTQTYYDLYPNDFSISWSVPTADSLFEKSEGEQIPLWQDSERFCTCPDTTDNAGKLEFECSVASVTTCLRENNYKSVHEGICQILNVEGRTKRTRHLPSFNSFKKTNRYKRSDKIIKNNSVNMTQEEALIFCKITLGNTTAFSACDSIPNVATDKALEICALDIVITQSLDWMIETMETLKAECIAEVQKNDTLQSSPENRNQSSIADEIENIVCPGLPECSGRGVCFEGECVCQDGYVEIDCSESLSNPPDLFGIRREGLCDLDTMPCDKAFLVGDRILYSKNLSCSVTDFVILINGEKHKTEKAVIDGHIETIIEVHCPVQNVTSAEVGSKPFKSRDVFIQGHSISVSYDRTNFGEEHDMYVFNSACQFVDTSSDPPIFSLLENTCFIDGKCFRHGDTDVYNVCHFCNSDTPYEWGVDATITGCGSTLKTKNSMAIVGPVVGVLSAVCVVIGIAILLRIYKAKTKNTKITDSNVNVQTGQSFELSMDTDRAF